MAVEQIASQSFQFLVELVRITLGRSLLLLPWTLVTSLAVLLAIAGQGQHLANLGQSSSLLQWFTLVLWFTCFALAGLLWGIHRALYDGVHNGIRLCQQRGAELAGSVLDPVLARLPLGKAEYPIELLRAQWSEWTGELVFRDADARWYWPAARLTNWLAQRWVNVQSAVVRQTLDELESFGEKAVSAASLKQYVVHRSAAAVADAARSNLRFWSLVTAAVIFLLMVVPASLAATIALATG